MIVKPSRPSPLDRLLSSLNLKTLNIGERNWLLWEISFKTFNQISSYHLNAFFWVLCSGISLSLPLCDIFSSIWRTIPYSPHFFFFFLKAKYTQLLQSLAIEFIFLVPRLSSWPTAVIFFLSESIVPRTGCNRWRSDHSELRSIISSNLQIIFLLIHPKAVFLYCSSPTPHCWLTFCLQTMFAPRSFS